MKIFVVPATYNERENIERFITVLEEEVFPKIKNHKMHILVADDNSPDGTGEIVKELMKKYENLGINQRERKGLGAAYLRTMGYAIDNLGADVVVSIDADFQFDPHDLLKYIEKLDEGYDMVVQTRYSDGGSIPENWPIQRKIFSISANLFVRSVFMRFAIHDWTGGFRAIKKEVFLKERQEMEGYNGYIFQIAFLHKAVRDGFKIGEVPLHFSDRKLGNSKIAPFDYIMNVFSFVLITRIKELQRFIKFLVVGGTGFSVQVASQEIAIITGIALLIASGVDNLTTGSMNRLIFSHSTAAAIGAESAIITNFSLNNFWTFSDTKKIKENSNFIIRLLRFNTTSVLAILIQFSAVWLVEELFGLSFMLFSYEIPTRIAILVPTIAFIIIPLNYFIYNKIIWKTQYLKHQGYVLDSKK